MLIEFLGNYPRIRVIDLLISNPYSEFSKTDIAESSKISRSTLYNFFEKLEEYDLIQHGNRYGQTQLYKVNTESPAIKALNTFQLRLAEIEINKQMEIYEAEDTADEEMDEEEVEQIFNMVDEIIDEEILERQENHTKHSLISSTYDALPEKTMLIEIFNPSDSSQVLYREELLFGLSSTSPLSESDKLINVKIVK
jgi:hypothetical protein